MKKTLIIMGAIFIFANSSASVCNAKVENQMELSIYGKSPLHLAISKGDIETVKKCIAYGVDINKIVNNMTPLMVAARFNQIEILKMLLEIGAKPFLENEKGLTALDYAEYAKAFESITVLKKIK